MDAVNQCVLCGQEMPEGGMVCGGCEKRLLTDAIGRIRGELYTLQSMLDGEFKRKRHLLAEFTHIIHRISQDVLMLERAVE